MRNALFITEETPNWIEDYFERETTVARKRVEDTETAIQQEQEDMRKAENVGLTTRESETMFQDMIVAIRDSLSTLATSDDEQDGEDEDDDDTELGKLSKDDKPGWVMGIISTTVQQRTERSRQKQMKLDKLTQQG